jgi:hypothetical protein
MPTVTENEAAYFENEAAYFRLSPETLRAAAAEVYKQAGVAVAEGDYLKALARQERAMLFLRNAAVRDQ